MNRVWSLGALTLIQPPATANILQSAVAAKCGICPGRLEEAIRSTRAVTSAATHFVPATVFSLDSWPLLCRVLSPRPRDLVKCLGVSKKAPSVFPRAGHSFNSSLFSPSLCLAWGWMPGHQEESDPAAALGIHRRVWCGGGSVVTGVTAVEQGRLAQEGVVRSAGWLRNS